MSILEYADELRVPLTHYQRELLQLIQANPNGYTHIIHKSRSHGFQMVQDIIEKYHNRMELIAQ